jgi:hypothetical protein
VAIEIKSSTEIHSHHLKGLKAFAEEHPETRKIMVSREKNRRISGGVEIMPLSDFLQDFWEDRIYEHRLLIRGSR